MPLMVRVVWVVGRRQPAGRGAPEACAPAMARAESAWQLLARQMVRVVGLFHVP